MSKRLDDLDSEFKLRVFELIARANEAGINVKIIDTLRTPEEQTENLARGVSWTAKSKHLPQEPEGKAKAIDLAPAAVLTMKHWAPSHPDWLRLGEIGERLGMTWGGRWTRTPDSCHFEVGAD